MPSVTPNFHGHNVSIPAHEWRQLHADLAERDARLVAITAMADRMERERDDMETQRDVQVARAEVFKAVANDLRDQLTAARAASQTAEVGG